MLEYAKAGVEAANRIKINWESLRQQMTPEEWLKFGNRLWGINGLRKLEVRAGDKIREVETIAYNLDAIGKDVIGRVQEFPAAAGLCKDILDNLPPRRPRIVRGARAALGSRVNEHTQRLISFRDFLSAEVAT